MNEAEADGDSIIHLIFLILYVGSLIHVFIESKRMREAAILNTIMVGLCFWPVPYFLWVFYWPGTLWRKFTGRKRLEPPFPFRFSRKN